jgi:hypothetical protein
MGLGKESSDVVNSHWSVKKPMTDEIRSEIRKIRMKREDSAFVYFILESHEGICSYSTLPFQPSDPHRDMILRIPPGSAGEVQEVLNQLGDKIYELK